MQKSFGIDGKIYEKALDEVGLTLNANALPSDKGGAFRPSGVRLGTPAITTRGLGEREMREIANYMKQVAKLCVKAGTEDHLEDFKPDFVKIHTKVKSLATRFPVPGI